MGKWRWISRGNSALCEGVQQCQSQQSLLACLLLQLCTQTAQNPCGSTALLLDTRWCGCLTEVAHEPCMVIQSLSDLFSPCHLKQPSWKLETLHGGRGRFSCSLQEKLGYVSHQCMSLWCSAKNTKPTNWYWITLLGTSGKPEHELKLPLNQCSKNSWGERVHPHGKISHLEEKCSGNHLAFTAQGKRNLSFMNCSCK